MPPNTFLTGALAHAAQIFGREDASVPISAEDRNNFVKNKVPILAEERLALVVRRPRALIKGTFAVQGST
ncbi:phage major capsid family protein [Methylobacterium sp. CM6257]